MQFSFVPDDYRAVRREISAVAIEKHAMKPEVATEAFAHYKDRSRGVAMRIADEPAEAESDDRCAE